jgi:hypothetical protein
MNGRATLPLYSTAGLEDTARETVTRVIADLTHRARTAFLVS